MTVHSAKGGSGKSTIVSNLAVALANEGKSVGLIDMDYGAPGLHILLGCSQKEMRFSLDDVLDGKASLKDAVIDLTEKMNLKRGQIVFLSSSHNPSDMINTVRRGYDVPALEKIISQMSEKYSLDYVLVDTRHGVGLSSLPAIAISDLVLFVARLDRQDEVGSKAPLQVARALKKQVLLVGSMIPYEEENERMKKRLVKMFGLPLAAILPYDRKLQMNQSSGIFILKKQQSDYAQRMNALASKLIKLNDMKPAQIADHVR